MTTRSYWWIKTVLDGKPQLIFGSDVSEDAARCHGMEVLGGIDFEIKKLHHRDISSASAELRGKRLDAGEGLRAATQRLGHEKSVKRIRRRMMREGQSSPEW